MKTKDQIAEIFLREAKNVVDSKFDELSVLSDKILNKDQDASEEYKKIFNELSKILPSKGITEEEMKSFLPYVKEYQSEIAFYIMSKIFRPGGD